MSRNQTALYKQKVVVLKGAHWGNSRCFGGAANVVQNLPGPEFLLNLLFRHRSKKTSKFRVIGLVRGIQRWLVNSPYKEPVKRKMFSFDDIIMANSVHRSSKGNQWIMVRQGLTAVGKSRSCCLIGSMIRIGLWWSHIISLSYPHTAFSWFHYSHVSGVSSHHKSLASLLVVQQLVQSNSKECMGQITVVRQFCYLVLLSNDSKTR